MAFVEDLSVFFDPNAPGIKPAYWNGATDPVYGEFQVNYYDMLGNLSEDRDFSFICPAASLPAVAVDDALVIDGASYKVFSAMPDLALTTLKLKKQ